LLTGRHYPILIQERSPVSKRKNDKNAENQTEFNEEFNEDKQAEDAVNNTNQHDSSLEESVVDNEQSTTSEEDAVEDAEKLQIEELEERLLEVQKQADENLNGWQRSLAEFSNYKKRTERESNETRTRLKGEILLPLLDVYDDLKLAIQDRPTEGEAAQWAAGIEMIFLKFQSLLHNMEVEEIEEKDVPFDPNLHEAITYEESDEVEEGYVIDVFQSGYRIGDRILRPARVRVAR
jgi:molecular chaperone GrpE